MDTTNTKQLANYDLFDLIGIPEYDPQKKKQILDRSNQLIISEFLLTEISAIEDEDEIKRLQTMADQKKPYDELIAELGEIIPDFYEKLYDFSLLWKENYIISYFKNVIKDLENKLQALSLESAKITVKKDMDQYEKALELATNKDWATLASFFSKQDS